MNPTSIRYGANFQVIGKGHAKNLSYAGAWQKVRTSWAELASHIGKGHPWMPALLDGNAKRWQSNANYAELLALDIDEGMTIGEAIAHPFISQHCSLGIESASSTTEHNKFRLAFRLPHAATDWQSIRICNRYLAHIIGSADPACKDANRFFFGAPGRSPFLLNESVSLPERFIDEALAWHEDIEKEEQRKEEQAQRQWEKWRSQHSEKDSDALILDALDCISPDCDYSQWIAIGMALAGMGDQWFSSWDSWSAGSSTYNAREMQSRWKSFRGKRPAPEVVFGIAKKYGFRFPAKQQKEWRGDRQAKDQVVDKTLWQIGQLFDRATYKFFKRFGHLPENPHPNLKNTKPETEPECLAIVPYDHNQVSRWSLEVKPGTVPSVEYWESVGRPKLVFNPDERADILIELIKNGYQYFALTDIVGEGKSHTTGTIGDNWKEISADLADYLEVDAVKAYFLSNDYRNPPVAGVERIPEVPSGAAIKLDTSKQTPLGNTYRRRARDGETPDIDGLCAHDGVIQSLNEKGIVTPRGEESSYCQDCEHFNGCPFIYAMKGIANETALRTDINKLSVEEDETIVAFVDEAGRSLKQHQELQAGLTTLDKEINTLFKTDERLYKEIYPLVLQIQKGIERAIAEGGRFTMNHADVMKFLPSKARLHELLFDAQWEKWQFAKTAWDIPSMWEIAGRMNGILRPNINELLKKAATPEERESIIKRDLTIGLLPRLIRVIDGCSREDVSISTSRAKDGSATPTITVTKPSRKHARAIAKTHSTILMDATPDFIEMAQCLGIKRHEIVQVEAKRPSFKNLTIKVVKGLGNVGAIREHYKDGSLVDSPYSQHNRIHKAVEAIAHQAKEQKPDVKLGLLDLKRYVDGYRDLLDSSGVEHVTGYHFRDNRGSNQFKDCEVMISVGQPKENIGSLLAQWKIKTGQPHTSKTAPDAFWAWVGRKAMHETVQDIGRDRAQHRPETPITHWVLSALSEKQIDALKDYFPGCTVETVDAYDICPEAADRGTQSTRGIIDALYQQIREGRNPKIDEIAKQMGITKGRVSQIVKTLLPEGFRSLKKSLVWLLEAINSQTKLSELDESLQWIATSYLPTLANQLRSGDDPAALLDEFVMVGESVGAAAFRKLLTATPRATLATFLGTFSSLMSADNLRSLQRMLTRSLEGVT